MERIEIANKIAAAINGKVWTTEKNEQLDKCRVYGQSRGYAEINDDGVNIDAVNRNQYDAVKAICDDLGVTTYRR